MKRISADLAMAEEYWEVRRAAKHYILPAILQGYKPDINLMNAAYAEEDLDCGDPPRASASRLACLERELGRREKLAGLGSSLRGRLGLVAPRRNSWQWNTT